MPFGGMKGLSFVKTSEQQSILYTMTDQLVLLNFEEKNALDKFRFDVARRL